MTRPYVDYLVAREGLPEPSGLVSDYVLGGDGLFLRTANDLLSVCMQIAPCTVRGLKPLGQYWLLRHGRLPQDIWDEMVDIAAGAAVQGNEIMMAVVRTDSDYELVVPPQEVGPAHVRITEPVAGAVMELHSHCRFGAYFSATDTADEQGLRVYGVIGRVNTNKSEFVLRVGAYGYFIPVRWTEVFQGDHPGMLDAHDPDVDGEEPGCRVKRVAGDGGMGDEDALSPEELDNGMRSLFSLFRRAGQ
jgi:PRTRC genetic system protein A